MYHQLKSELKPNTMKTKMKVGSKIEDREGNRFVIQDFTRDRETREINGVSIKSASGHKEISIHDLQYYNEVKN